MATTTYELGGQDILKNKKGDTADVTIKPEGWEPNSKTSNSGTANIDTNGFLVNV